MHIVKILPECPYCGSVRTGLYIYEREHYPKRKQKAFVSGLRVRLASRYESHGNLFCSDCGRSFSGKIKRKILSEKEFYGFLLKKGFLEDRNGLMQNEERRRNQKPQKKKEKSDHEGLRLAVTIFTGIDIRKKKK
jgi:hypothetical protein